MEIRWKWSEKFIQPEPKIKESNRLAIKSKSKQHGFITAGNIGGNTNRNIENHSKPAPVELWIVLWNLLKFSIRSFIALATISAWRQLLGINIAGKQAIFMQQSYNFYHFSLWHLAPPPHQCIICAFHVARNIKIIRISGHICAKCSCSFGCASSCRWLLLRLVCYVCYVLWLVSCIQSSHQQKPLAIIVW